MLIRLTAIDKCEFIRTLFLVTQYCIDAVISALKIFKECFFVLGNSNSFFCDFSCAFYNLSGNIPALLSSIYCPFYYRRYLLISIWVCLLSPITYILLNQSSLSYLLPTYSVSYVFSIYYYDINIVRNYTLSSTTNEEITKSQILINIFKTIFELQYIMSSL